MKNKINIAELLRNCPKGMELDCTLYEDVYFDGIAENISFPIAVSINCDGEIWTKGMNLTNEGKLGNHPNAKCVIFPKGKTTWEGFVPPCKFKDGDIIFTHANCLKVGLGNTWISIYQEKRNGGVATYVDYAEDGSDYYSNIDGDKPLLCFEKDILRQRLATEEEKQKLFQAIKDNGYKWNAETKTLEKLVEPKFKVGDKIKKKGFDDVYAIEIATVGEAIYTFKNSGFQYIESTDKNYELVPNKFDITTLKPFESKVLARDGGHDKWRPEIWGLYDNKASFYPYCVLGGQAYAMCIPYNGNEHLLGTTNDCEDFYKTW